MRDDSCSFSVLQRSFAVKDLGSAQRFHAVRTPQLGGIRESCFIKRKGEAFISNNRIFRNKHFVFLGK